jgi:hypothetical protein
MNRKAILYILGLVVLLCGFQPAAAQGPPLGPGMVGPLHPPILNTTGTGTPSPGDMAVGLSMMGPNLLISYPSTMCGTPNIMFSNMVGGKYQMATLTRFPAISQMVSISQSMGGRPTMWSFTENGNHGMKSGLGGVVDRNGDGVYDGVQGQGAGMAFDISFLYKSVTGHSYGDYASFPWSQVAALGVLGNCKVGGTNPMAFVPMADTNGDGIPDSVVMDLNGDGVADPEFAPLPVISSGTQPLDGIGPNQVPTFSQWAAFLVTVALAGAGWLQLRKQGPALL